MRWLAGGLALTIVAAVLAPTVEIGQGFGDHEYDYIELTTGGWRLQIEWGRA